MAKPSKEQLLTQVSRGGRVFLFEYEEREKGCLMPSYESGERITQYLLSALPGCQSVDGPFVNGIIAITIDDTKSNASTLSDGQIRERIASIFHRHWRE